MVIVTIHLTECEQCYICTCVLTAVWTIYSTSQCIVHAYKAPETSHSHINPCSYRFYILYFVYYINIVVYCDCISQMKSVIQGVMRKYLFIYIYTYTHVHKHTHTHPSCPVLLMLPLWGSKALPGVHSCLAPKHTHTHTHTHTQASTCAPWTHAHPHSNQHTNKERGKRSKRIWARIIIPRCIQDCCT